MAYAVPEEDAEEAARLVKTEVTWLGGKVNDLKSLRLAAGTPEGRFIERMDLQLNVFRRQADASDVEKIKTLSWKYRRQMPTHSRPKLPPDDPVVREMEANGG